jgi:parvulin-like peptidyl-prolyl isomerase
MHNTTRRAGLTALLLALLLLEGCNQGNSAPAASAAAPASAAAKGAQQPAGVVARVGDEVITYSALSTMLNSSAMVGLSIPALGTPERRQVLITLLDKVISADLLYLDAKQKGVDQRPPYSGDIAKFEAAILASLYKSRVLIGNIDVSEAEVRALYASGDSQEGEPDADVRLALESQLRKRKLEERKATLRERLREGVEITIDAGVTNPDKDAARSDGDVVATLGGEQVTWGEIRPLMRGADHRASLAEFYIDSSEERMKRLQQHLDNRLLVSKARAAGLDRDPEFARRTAEYRKTRLINVHREQLLQSWKPSDDELENYYLDHQQQIVAPESRKVQMVVVKTREEAEKIKAQIDSGEITIYQAAQQYSLDPNAKRTLGEMGWVTQGSGFEGLDDFTFSLEPEVVGGPVESPAGWHLVKVLDVLDGRYQNIADAETRKRTLRMYLKEKLDAYVVALRKNSFAVEVYDDELARRFQQEAEMIAELGKKAEQEGSVTRQRQQELQKWITPPVQE